MRCRSLLAAGLGLAVAIAAFPEDWIAAVAAPSRVLLRNQVQVVGRIIGVEGGNLVLERTEGGGAAHYRVPVAEIAAVRWSGEEAVAAGEDARRSGDHAAALEPLGAVAAQRLTLAAVLSADDLRPLVWLADSKLRSGAPTEATVLARQVERAVAARGTGPAWDALRRELGEVRLRAALAEGLEDEARGLAEAWCRGADPTGPDVVGWAALSLLHWRAGRRSEALWSSLPPIAFGSPAAGEDIAVCYAVAIASGVALGREGEARRWAAEFAARSLEWPPEPSLAAAGAWVRSAPVATPIAVEPAAKPAAPVAPDSARRLIAAPTHTSPQ